eukprot:scaffold215645_cov42-Attheya_sp.AAC.2
MEIPRSNRDITTDGTDDTPKKNHLDDSSKSAEPILRLKEFQMELNRLRSQYATRYGGEEASQAMFAKGVTAYHPKGASSSSSSSSSSETVQHTAERILRAAVSRTFVMAFAGYSVTVGRGNRFEQSFPFVVQDVLEKAFELLGMALTVRNAAIGGIPSFPYAWCMRNFLGSDADVISWDFGLNEGNGAQIFEAYLRQAMVQLPKNPKMMLLDNKNSRQEMLQTYVDAGVLLDPIALGQPSNVKGMIDSKYLSMPEEERPEGYQKWDEWGSPRGSPGQNAWHPKYKEHELIGWNVAMHMLPALERAAEIMAESPNNWRETYGATATSTTTLIPPKLPDSNNDASIQRMLYGKEGTSTDAWEMNAISCRTSFLPVVDTFHSLTSAAISGVANIPDDALASRDEDAYTNGWVLDVGKTERNTKRKVEKIGGLGYIDMKLALYGIPSSGTIQFWLSHEPKNNDTPQREDDKAVNWFDALVICEVNEKRGPNECQMERDMEFIVGGSPVSSFKTPEKIKGVASYLQKEVCVHVPIPPDAKITRRNINKDDQINHVGLTVEVSVTGQHVTRADGACSISHIVWEQH